jgi:hypothetical protein
MSAAQGMTVWHWWWYFRSTSHIDSIYRSYMHTTHSREAASMQVQCLQQQARNKFFAHNNFLKHNFAAHCAACGMLHLPECTETEESPTLYVSHMACTVQIYTHVT